MRKKELLSGNFNVYSIFDKVSKHYKNLFFCNNDEEFIRMYLPTIVLENALRDIIIYKVGIFNDVTGEIKNCTKKRVATDCYLFPHSRLSPVGENHTPEEIEKAVQVSKNEILAKMAEDNINKEGDKENE